MLLNKSIQLTLLLCIGFSLINAGTFGDLSYFAYFMYSIAVCIVALTCLYTAFISRQPSAFISLPLVSFILLVTYILIHGIQTNGLWLSHYYWLINVILLLSASYWLVVSQDKQLVSNLFRGMILFAAAEALIVIFQFADILPVINKKFAVTGTWTNPNVTAMFLAIVLPACIHQLIRSNRNKKKINIFALGVIVAAILLLKCRTAYIGAIVGAGIILNDHYQLNLNFRNSLSRARQIRWIALMAIVIICSGYLLYISKQKSADGRKFVWEISAAMVADKPVSGYGYGSFDKYYNLSQAGYFAAGKGTETELANASFVHMAYNEFLQNAVEGGILGLILFVMMLSAFLLTKRHNKPVSVKEHGIDPGKAARAGVIAFTMMSVFNFTVQAIPVMCITMLYLAILNKEFRPVKLSISHLFFQRLTISVLIIFTLVIGIVQLGLAKAYAANKDISFMMRRDKASTAMPELQALGKKLQKADAYWINYGNSLLRQRDYNGAIDKYKRAVDLRPYCETYLLLAQCYQKSNRNDSAVNACIMAKNIEPGRMLPSFVLMQLYASANDTIHAVAQARELLQAEPRILSKEASFYKLRAKQLCKQYNVSKKLN